MQHVRRRRGQRGRRRQQRVHLVRSLVVGQRAFEQHEAVGLGEAGNLGKARAAVRRRFSGARQRFSGASSALINVHQRSSTFISAHQHS